MNRIFTVNKLAKGVNVRGESMTQDGKPVVVETGLDFKIRRKTWD